MRAARKPRRPAARWSDAEQGESRQVQRHGTRELAFKDEAVPFAGTCPQGVAARGREESRRLGTHLW